MALRSGSRKKSGSARSGDAGDTDLIAELKGRIAVLEDELRLKQECATFSDVIERKQAEEALKKSEEKYRRIVETANEGIWIIDRDRRTTFVNDRMSSMLGYTSEEMSGKKIEDFTSESDLSLLHSSMARHVSGVTVRLDYRFCRKDGSHLWCFISATPILDEKGDFAGGIAMITDITERKQTEEALRESEEKYRFLVENSKDVIWKIDLEGRWTFVSGNVERVNGYRPDEMVGKPVWGFIAPECHGFIREKLHRRMRGEEVTPYIAWSANKDGSRTPLEVVTTSILDESGKIMGVQGISRDITLRMRVEEALQESERRYRGIVQDQTELIALLDIDVTITFVNDAYCRYFGKKREELVGQTFLTLVSEEDREAVKASISGLSQNNPAASIEQRVKLPDGSLAWMDWKNRIVFDDHGRPTGYQSVGRDITERKRAEEALRRSEEGLKKSQEIAHLGNWELDLVNNRLSWSDEVYRIFGLRPGEFGATYEAFLEAVHPDDRAAVDAAYSVSVREGRDSYEIEHRVVRRSDGEVRIVHEKGEHFKDESGQIIRSVGMVHDITERRRAEEALRESEERLRAFLENSKVIGWMKDEDGRYVYLSRNFIRRFNVRFEDWHGRTDFEFWPREMAEEFRKNDLAVLEGGRSFEVVEEAINPDGSKSWWLSSKFPFQDASGKRYVGGLAVDITQRKRAEEAVKFAYAYNRSLIEASLDPLVTISPDGKITDVNLATEMVTGVSRDKLVGTDFSDYFTDPDMARKGYKKVFEEGSVKDYPLELRHRDGHITPVLYNATVYRDENGKVIGVFAAARDITERKKAEEALRKSEAALKKAQEIVHMGSWEWDLVNDKVTGSDEMYRMFGMAPDSMLSMYQYIELFVREDRQKVLDRLDKLVKDNVPYNIDHQVVLHDGTRRFVHVDAEVHHEDGRPAKVYGTVLDITERKRAEEALMEAKAQAELYVDLMGHDINNMNQVSMGFLELAHNLIEMEGKLDEENIVLLDKAMNSLNNSSQLIDNVRKLQREKMGLYRPEVLDVDSVIGDAAKHFHSIPGRDVKIVFTPREHCLVSANGLLKDVFINLIGNAVKHSKGALTVNIRVDQVTDKGVKYCRVAVEDDGPGIPDGLKATLFDRLNLTTTRARGKGFGLCLIKMLVDDYHGRFWAEDRVPGDHTQGARFVVMLPAVEK